LAHLGERRTTVAEAYGIKVRHYGEHVGEQIGEHIGNQGKMKKKSFPPETLKGKKQDTLSACLGLPLAA